MPFFRFYSVLFRKLFDPEFGHTTKQSMFLNLLYRVLKRDESLSRLRTFVKRILQVCLSCPPQLGCALLYLVSELIKFRPELQNFPNEIVQLKSMLEKMTMNSVMKTLMTKRKNLEKMKHTNQE